MGDQQLRRPQLVALSFAEPALPIEPAPRRRAWMENAHERWPNRCLPLLVANEAGWVLRNPHTFRATWNGDERPSGVTIEFCDGEPQPYPVSSHFGHGVITWGIPYVFRTSTGFNLLARGPANWPKEGISPLEGLVETDWASVNFTMNWKLTSIGLPVIFEAGEPFCMLVPQRRGELESFRTEVRGISSDLETNAEFRQFVERRHDVQVHKFLSQYSAEYESYRKEWERNYYQGKHSSGTPAPTHQTRLHLDVFKPGAEPNS